MQIGKLFKRGGRKGRKRKKKRRKGGEKGEKRHGGLKKGNGKQKKGYSAVTILGSFLKSGMGDEHWEGFQNR